MKYYKYLKFALLVTIVTSFLAAAGTAQIPQRRATDRQVRIVLDRLSSKTVTFRNEVERNRTPWNNQNSDERIADLVTAFANSVSSLRSSVIARSDSSDEVTELLGRANRVNMFLNRNTVTSRITTRWNSIRTDVNTLAGYYQVSWNWNQPNNGGGGFPGGGGRFGRLNGTYRLNTSQSDNVNTVIDRSVGYYGTNQRDNVRRTLERRLRSPETIAIEKNGRSITMASNIQQQVTFDADGVPRTETNARGRTITTTVTDTRNGFTINYQGDRVDDFNVTFVADRNGRLRVTRRIYLENRNDTVTVASVYDRVSEVAQWPSVDPRPGGPTVGGGTIRDGNFYIPNGVSLSAVLQNTINTRATQAGDRFTMEVTEPSQYRGALIEGRVSQAASSGRVTGRATVSLDFDTITVNGRQYAFAGIIDSVSTVNGDSVTVNNEGQIRDSSQTTKTATRAGIGAILGAIIGAVAGGGQGAAIGAGVGAGAGAGSVLVMGRDRIQLDSGSTFRITATAPTNVGYVRN